MLVNLLPYWIIQPWVDAAFKKRGIDPEEFWRNAGLPAFRFPDPNGQRSGQRCPAAGADAAGGHAGAPRSCRHRGLAVLVHAGPGQLPDAGQPAAVRAGRGRTVRDQPVRRQQLWAARRARCCPPNPNAPPPAPGVPSAAFPGEFSPPVQGTPAAAVRAGSARSPHGSGHPGYRRIRTSRPDPCRVTARRRRRLHWSVRSRRRDRSAGGSRRRHRCPATRRSFRPDHKVRGHSDVDDLQRPQHEAARADQDDRDRRHGACSSSADRRRRSWAGTSTRS